MAIQQHPIPQEVAGYKFRLIGDMTVKQFIWLASGIVLGIIFYSLPLPFFFKYPLAGVAIALGAGTAFLPIQGRPMDKWIIAFIKSIYSPTQYVWSKQSEDSAYSRGTKTQPPTPPIPPPNEGGGQVGVSKPVSNILPISTPAPAPPSPAPLPAVKPVVPPPPQPQTSTVPTGRLPIPFTPTTGNTLVGMTLTTDSKILPGTLIEIKLKGSTIRATKSNQLGQFLFAKPLENGLYQIVTEKDGFKFDTYSLNLTGQIVKPLKLQAKT